jgi:hypothetical protein
VLVAVRCAAMTPDARGAGRVAVLATILFALAACSAASPEPAATQGQPAPVAATTAAASPSPSRSLAPMSHDELCKWSADMANRFGEQVPKNQDARAIEWDRLSMEAGKAGEVELVRIANDIAVAIRRSDFATVTRMFEDDLRAVCLDRWRARS